MHHRDVVEALSRDASGTPAAFGQWDGAALASTFEEMIESTAAGAFLLALPDYPELFDALAASRMVRRPGAPGARVRIYGPLEARLQQADRVVLGGLVEGTWPPETAKRSLAQPPDAARSWARSARTADRPVRA